MWMPISWCRILAVDRAHVLAESVNRHERLRCRGRNVFTSIPDRAYCAQCDLMIVLPRPVCSPTPSLDEAGAHDEEVIQATGFGATAGLFN